MKPLLRIAKWLMISIATVFLLLFAYVNYVIMRFDTETLPDNHGKVQTELFLSDSDNQPLVVGLGGSEGGNGWAGKHGKKQRELLQENGYAFLAVAYFGADGIPKNLDRIAIEGVHKAVIEASQHPQIDESRIAVLGVSRGSELALLLGSYYSEYKCVVGIVPGSSVFAIVASQK